MKINLETDYYVQNLFKGFEKNLKNTNSIEEAKGVLIGLWGAILNLAMSLDSEELFESVLITAYNCLDDLEIMGRFGKLETGFKPEENSFLADILSVFKGKANRFNCAISS